IRQNDINNFLEKARLKFLGYKLEGDNSTDAGLPTSIIEGLKVLKSYLYVSHGEWQIKNEKKLTQDAIQNIFKDEIADNPTEILYQAILPKIQQYMIALLKILLVASPTTKSKTESFNILVEVLPKANASTMRQTLKVAVDAERHKEIIVEAISAILLLLLKHFKVNHILQFEHMAQNLVFANCIPLILKHLNQNLVNYLILFSGTENLEFPACVLNKFNILSHDDKENPTYSWRGIFSCINLTRILQKLTKWRPSRIMMLVVFKSAPILKRALKLKEETLQLYLLKLIKPQTRYLGRNWRKSNMKIVSMIYQRVRHHLNDDWAYGVDQDSQPWDYQVEESDLRAQIERFNNRRYSDLKSEVLPDCLPYDNNWISVLSKEIQFADAFIKNYEEWLENEVHQRNLNWDSLCTH
ncbi:uncharacterized protein TRIADDRAFT_23499, partial [Trichoplax adhaerens]